MAKSRKRMLKKSVPRQDQLDAKEKRKSPTPRIATEELLTFFESKGIILDRKNYPSMKKRVS